MHNYALLVVLVLTIVCSAGCTGVSGPPQIQTGITLVTTATLAPDTWSEPPDDDNITAAKDCLENTGETRSYPMNITDANKNPLSRKEFFEVNREYMTFLAKEIGQEKAEQMINDKFSHAMENSLLDPSSGNDTLISIIIDPVGFHTAGETFDITGSTNLPPGRVLTLVIFQGNYDRAILPCEDPWHDPVLRTAVVQPGQSSKNTWSYSMNTTGLISDDYLIYVRESQKEGVFLTNSLFHLY